MLRKGHHPSKKQTASLSHFTSTTKRKKWLERFNHWTSIVNISINLSKTRRDLKTTQNKLQPTKCNTLHHSYLDLPARSLENIFKKPQMTQRPFSKSVRRKKNNHLKHNHSKRNTPQPPPQNWFHSASSSSPALSAPPENFEKTWAGRQNNCFWDIIMENYMLEKGSLWRTFGIFVSHHAKAQHLFMLTDNA